MANEITTAQDMLTRWDSGQPTWTIEMGGLGPGYEQAIQITMFEVLRHLIDADYSEQDYKEDWDKTRDKISNAVSPKIDALGLSGAQWGAAVSLATTIHIRGPEAMSDDEVKDRRIQASKNDMRFRAEGS